MKIIWWVIIIAIIAVLVYLGFFGAKEETTEVPAGASVTETVEGVVDSGAAATVTE